MKGTPAGSSSKALTADEAAQLVAALQSELVGVKTTVASLEETIANLAQENLLLKRRLFGNKTERSHTSEMQLALGDLLATEARLQNELDAAVAQAKKDAGGDAGGPGTPSERAKPKGRRDLLASKLPRFAVEIRDEEMEAQGCRRKGRPRASWVGRAVNGSGFIGQPAIRLRALFFLSPPLTVPARSVTICVSLGSIADDVATEILVRIVRDQNLDARHVSFDELQAWVTPPSQEGVEGVKIVYVVSAFPSDERSHGQSTAERMRGYFPHAVIVALFLPGMLLQPERERETLPAADLSASSFDQALHICLDMGRVPAQ